MLYDYKAISATGRTVKGQVEASHLTDLEARLKRLDLDLISGNPARGRKFFPKERVSRRQLINFCFHLEQLARSGVPILESLSDLRDAPESPRFRQVVACLIEDIEGGQTLSQAMSSHPRVFGHVLTRLVGAGETAGQLPEVLASLVETLKWEDELASHARKLVTYPAFVGCTVLATASFLMVWVVPQLRSFVTALGQTLPLQTRILFFLSDLIAGYWHALLLAAAAATLGLHLALRHNPLARVWADGLKLRTPLIGGIVTKMIFSRFAGTFAMLYAAGIPILQSLRITQDIVGNRIVRRALESAEQAIEEGQKVSDAFQAAGLFPPLVVRMLRVGENTGRLDQALLNVSYFYSRDVRESAEKAQAMMEPILTLLMGTLIGWIMLSVIGPIYDIVSGIRL